MHTTFWTGNTLNKLWFVFYTQVWLNTNLDMPTSYHLNCSFNCSILECRSLIYSLIKLCIIMYIIFRWWWMQRLTMWWQCRLHQYTWQLHMLMRCWISWGWIHVFRYHSYFITRLLFHKHTLHTKIWNISNDHNHFCMFMSIKYICIYWSFLLKENSYLITRLIFHKRTKLWNISNDHNCFCMFISIKIHLHTLIILVSQKILYVHGRNPSVFIVLINKLFHQYIFFCILFSLQLLSHITS